MKIFFRILAVFIFVLLFLIATPRIVEFIWKRQIPEMTPEKAQKIFETSGGINEINREVKILFDRLGTNDFAFLYPDGLTNTPAISLLYSNCQKYSAHEYFGTHLAIFPENGRHLEVVFGNHWSLRHFYIFDPNSPVTFNSPSNWFQVSSNIFASK